jgi:hypothetical protein
VCVCVRACAHEVNVRSSESSIRKTPNATIGDEIEERRDQTELYLVVCVCVCVCACDFLCLPRYLRKKRVQNFSEAKAVLVAKVSVFGGSCLRGRMCACVHESVWGRGCAYVPVSFVPTLEQVVLFRCTFFARVLSVLVMRCICSAQKCDAMHIQCTWLPFDHLYRSAPSRAR